MKKYQLLFSLLFLSIFTFSTSARAEDASLNKKLYNALLFQDLELIKQLITKGANVNYIENGRPLLGWASQNANPAVVELLLNSGAKPNITDKDKGHSPLMRAIDTQSTPIVTLLLKFKADPNYINSSGESCLIMGVKSRKPEIVQALVSAGADVKFVTSEGDSAVLTAALDGTKESIEIISILGKAKAPMDISNAAWSALEYAIEQQNKDLVTALLDAGANPNAKDKSGHLPVVSALEYPEILELVLKAKANPNVEDDYKGTPLLTAIQNNNIKAVGLLLNAGADPNKKDSSGSTPLEIAERANQTEISDLIRPKLTLPKDVKTYSAESGLAQGKDCTIVDAAKRQMELHGKLQAQVTAGKMSDNIFRTFADDTEQLSTMLVENPAEACRLFDRLGKKYGVE